MELRETVFDEENSTGQVWGVVRPQELVKRPEVATPHGSLPSSTPKPLPAFLWLHGQWDRAFQRPQHVRFGVSVKRRLAAKVPNECRTVQRNDAGPRRHIVQDQRRVRHPHDRLWMRAQKLGLEKGKDLI